MHVRADLVIQMVDLASDHLEFQVVVRVERAIALRLQVAQLRFDLFLVDSGHDVVFVPLDAQGLAQRGQQVLLVHLRRALDGVPGDFPELGDRFPFQFLVGMAHDDLLGRRGFYQKTLPPARVARYAERMKKPAATSASALIDARITELGDWRGKMLAHVRRLIRQADPEIVEEWKYMGVPIWSHAGIVCTGETYKTVVKLTFAKGASLQDPSRLFNSSLDGKVRRAIDIREGEKVNEAALKDLVRAAVALNLEGAGKKKKPATLR